MLYVPFLLIAAYLIGSVSFSYIVTKKIGKTDIRKHGSGNAGATNTLRVLGIGPAIGVLVLDIIKGIIPVIIARLLDVPEWSIAATGFAAVLGHVYPVYYGFKGGKGVATTIGVFLTLSFLPALFAALAGVAVIASTRYVSLGSIVIMILAPVLSYFLGHHSITYIIFEAVLALLIIYKHKANIGRLFQGVESKIGQSNKTDGGLSS